MKERIFIISPLSEDEEEEKLPYDESGNTTAMAYYNEQGNTIETDYEEQPEENSAIEKHIIIIYEAPKPKVIFNQSQPSETTLTTKENPSISPNQPETNITTLSPYTHTESASYAEMQFGKLLPSYAEMQFGKLLPRLYGQPAEQSPTEQNQLTSIRSELQEIAIGSGAPAPQTGEIAQAA